MAVKLCVSFFSEGFGWPLIEAQAADSVIASALNPMIEVCGGAAHCMQTLDLMNL
jgi:hypothetical protein